jgi:hypothetical protein
MIMARGGKNYSEVTHKASKQGTKERQKAVWTMVGAKKKLHEMVEALIGGDSKAAASALHEYLQTKTRAILGEEHGEFDLDMDMGDDEGMGGEGEGSHEEFSGEDDHDPECEDPECDHEDHDMGDEHGEMDSDDDFDGDEFGNDESMMGEAAAMSTDSSVRTKTKHFGNNAKDLAPSVKGKLDYSKSARSGSKKSNSTEATKPFKGAHTNAAKDLGRKVSGNVKFAGNGKKAKLTKPHNNAAPGLDRKVKGKVKFD